MPCIDRSPGGCRRDLPFPLSSTPRLLVAASIFAAGLASPALAQQQTQPVADTPTDDILVTAQRQTQTIEGAPNSRASVNAATIETTINAPNVEDTLKYLPSLVVRKRHIGDSQAPLATRTSGLGASARSLIYADGALLSALVGNNNTTASPRWNLVSTEEIARIDVLYGPFSAAYPGNSIGAVVNITTRLPDKFEATLNVGTSVQQFDLHGTHRTYSAYQLGGTVGDRFGLLAVFASADHVDSRAQPLGLATGTRPTASSTTGTPTTGGFDDLNRSGNAIRVLGATGFEHQVQDRFKFRQRSTSRPGCGSPTSAACSSTTPIRPSRPILLALRAGSPSMRAASTTTGAPTRSPPAPLQGRSTTPTSGNGRTTFR